MVLQTFLWVQAVRWGACKSSDGKNGGAGPRPSTSNRRDCRLTRCPPPQPVAATPVSVTAAFAKARPATVPLVVVIAAPARMVPLKFESVIVAASATHQYTLHASAPSGVTTEKRVPVRAPVPPVPILNSQIPVEGPASVNVPVSVAAASKQ